MKREDKYYLILIFCVALCMIIVIAEYKAPDVPTVSEPTSQIIEPTSESIQAEMQAYLDEKAAVQNQYIENRTYEIETETVTESFKPIEWIEMDVGLQEQIKELCDRYEFSFEFFMGWMYTESQCRWVIGDSNDTGYMQIIPMWHQATAESMGIDIFSELGNCEYALILINEYLDTYDGDMTKALQHYNTGNGNTHNGYAELVYQNVERMNE